MNKICLICKTTIRKRPREGKRDWSTRKFCSLFCYWKYQRLHPNKGTFQIGNHPPTEFKKSIPPVPHKKGCKCFRCDNKFGGKHHNWKSNRVKYSGLHMWIRNRLGSYPPSCKFCKVSGKKNGRMWSIHWANKSRKYLRNVSDWIPLCRKCHKKYDS